MTDTTEPKPAKDKAMSEQIKPVDRYVVTKDGYLIPLEDGNVVYYSDHAETVQQLQQRCDRLLAALHQIANDPVITAATMRYLAQCAITAGIEVK